MMNRFAICLGTIGLISGGSLAGTVWYVDNAGGLNGNGQSWATAFADLQEALEFSQSGDEIWVRAGLYQPDIAAAGSADSGYFLEDGVAMYGGFVGTETQRNQRDAAANTTTLSGGLTTEVSHVIEGDGVGPGTIIDGFTISDGYGGDDGVWGLGGAGGAMLLMDSSPTVIDCIIQSNVARLGSGVYVQDGSPAFAGCIFGSNISARSGEGGAIYSIVTVAGQTQTLDVTDCEFNFNSVRQGHFATGNGGAIYTSKDVVLTVQESSFTSNFGWHNNTFGNAVVGGAIAALGGPTLIENCRFINNYSNLGAGIYSAGDIQIIQSLFTGNRAVIAATCGGFDCPSDVPDIASGFGGAVFVNWQSTLQMDQSTVANNISSKTGAGVVAFGSVRNSILWGNVSPQPCCGEDPLRVLRMQMENIDSVEFSCIEGLLTPEFGEDPPNPSSFPGSHENDPLFVDAAAGDFTLVSGSPSIDAGDNAMVPSGLVADLNGLARLSDDPDTIDTGPGGPPIVDMGVYEFQSGSVCQADMNGDAMLDIFDVLAFLDAFNTGDPGADFTGDGSFDIFDVLAFLDAFNAGCP